MIRRTFRKPNYRCEATDEDGVRSAWLTADDSADAVEERLRARGWTVHEVTPFDFQRWLVRSAELQVALEDAHARGETLKFDTKHWSQLKLHLFELFGGKCAYCEGRARHVSSGDVEHFRPKRGVHGEPNHPGYYWLAYDVNNLLPACERCNRAGAKMNQFPVEAGTRAHISSDVVNERPLLLHPYEDDPFEHLLFLPTGQVEGLTEKGRQSVVIYRLGRDELREARHDHLGFLENDYKTRVAAGGLVQAGRELVDELLEGKREYSAANLAHLSRMIAVAQRELAEEQRGLADVSDAFPPHLRQDTNG